MRKKTKRPYRKDCTADLDAIDGKRVRLDVTIEAMCLEADVSVTTWWRMRRSGLGFTRRIRALKFALRTIEQRRQRGLEDRAFPEGDR